MDFELSPEQELLRESVRRFLAERAPVTPYVRAQLADPRGCEAPVWAGLAELGLTGMLVPEPLGGSGLGMLEMGVVLEEMGRCVHPGPYFASSLGATSLILAAGDPDDHDLLLPQLAAGRLTASVALYEPDHGYDWRSPEARAVPSSGTGGWQLSGEKVQVLDVMACDLLLVSAEVDGDLGVFVTEPASQGVALASSDSVDGTRKRGRLQLDGAPARRLGGRDPSAAIAQVVDRLAVGACADGVGAASRALEMCVEYARERVQFDRPIGAFQAIQHMLADMLQAVELARAATYYALWSADAETADAFHRAASIAKAFASEALPRLGADAIQVFGGVGFTWEYDIHLYFKRLLSLQSDFGDEVEHLEEIARLVLDDAR